MIIRIDGKTWSLPDKLHIENEYTKKVKYKVIGYRKPKKGEYYLSGAIPMIYQACNDLSFNYLVVNIL